MSRRRGPHRSSLLGSSWQHLLGGAGPGAKKLRKHRRLGFESCEGRRLLTATVSGLKFNDLDADGTRDPGEGALQGVVIDLFRDTNANGTFEPGADTLVNSAATDVAGNYQFADLTDGRYFIREIPGAGQTQTTPSGPNFYTLDVAGDNVFPVRQVSELLIDDFELPNPAFSYNILSPTNPDPEVHKFAGAGVVGGERDLLIDVLGDPTFASATGTVGQSNGQGLFEFASLTPGVQAILQYDGLDADDTTPDKALINARQLGGIDVSGGGIINGIRIDFTRLEVPGSNTLLDVQIRLTGPGAATATFTGTIPENPDPFSFFVPYSSFVLANSFSFGNVTSIEVDLNPTGVQAVDFAIDRILASEERNDGFDFGNNTAGIAAIELVKLTNGTDNNAAPGPTFQVGDEITFRYEVSNPGDVPLSITNLTDDGGPGPDLVPEPVLNGAFNQGDADQDNLLDPGETWLYEADYTVALVPGDQYMNTATVTAFEEQTGQTPSDSDVEFHTVVNPQITLVKLTNGADHNAAPGLPLLVGSTATFTYYVGNPGTISFAQVVLTDDDGGIGVPFNPTPVEVAGRNVGDVNGDGQLNPTETWTYTATRIVTVGEYVNTATVVGTSEGIEEQAQDVEHINGIAATVDVEKLVRDLNGVFQDADSPTGPFLAPNSTPVFQYVVSGAGNNVELENVVVLDDNGTPGDTDDDVTLVFASGDTDGDLLLDPSETWLFEFPPGVSPMPVAVGQNSCSARVTANPVGLESVELTDSDPANYFGALGGIDVIKRVNGDDANTPTGPHVPAGSQVSFTYEVRNTGNSPLSDVELVDDGGPNEPSFLPTPVTSGGFNIGDADQDNQLDVGEVWQYVASGTAETGQNTCSATATAETVLETPVSDTDPANFFGDPQVASIAGYVWIDTNRDNVRQPGELAIQGVQVTLMGTTNGVMIDTFTDSNGAFSFTNLPPGTYKLIETQPAEFIDNDSAVGSGVAQGGNRINSNQLGNIVLQGGESGVEYRFGEAGRNPTLVSKLDYTRPRTARTSALARLNAATAAATQSAATRSTASRTIVRSSGTVTPPPVPSTNSTSTSSKLKSSLSRWLRRR